MRTLFKQSFVVAVALCWAIWVTVALTLPFSGLVPDHKDKEHRESTEEKPSAGEMPFVFRIGHFIDQYNGAFTALATVAIAWFTFSLKASTDKMWKASTDALELGNREFIASHLPRLRVQRVECSFPDVGQQAAAEVVIVNVGDSDATITAIGAAIFLRHLGLEETPWNPTPRPLAETAVLAPGQPTDIPVSTEEALVFEQVRSVNIGERELVLVGMVRYEDDNGISRLTGFCRRYHRDKIRYIRVDASDPHADYEFEG
jgi:hypothetical protein